MIKNNQKKGIVSVIAVLMLGIMLLLGAYFLSFTITESKISKSQEVASQTYYLAETGISEAVWKLKNDSTDTDGDFAWSICFVTSTAGVYPCDCTSGWSADFIMNTSNLIPNSTVTVTIISSGCGRGEIISTSTINLSGGKTAQRVIKTTVYKALAGPTENASLLTGGASQNVTVSGSKLRVYGNFYINSVLNISGSDVEIIDSPANAPEVDGRILATGNYLYSGNSLSAVAVCASNYCNTTTTCNCEAEPSKFEPGWDEFACPPKSLDQPLVDFNSGESISFYQRALADQNAGQCEILCNGSPCTVADCGGTACGDKCIITTGQFSSILTAVGVNGTTTLNSDITYITNGGFDLRCRRLVINGALIANGKVDIGTSISCGANAQITINMSNSTTSGLLALGDMTFGPYSFLAPTTITGIIYAYDKKLEFSNLPQELVITGGAIGRKVDIINVANLLTFNLDNEVILYGLGRKIDGVEINPVFSPIITTDHWEESY